MCCVSVFGVCFFFFCVAPSAEGLPEGGCGEGEQQTAPRMHLGNSPTVT